MGNSSSTESGWRRTDTVRRFRKGNELVTERLYTKVLRIELYQVSRQHMREEWREVSRVPHPDYLAEQARVLNNEGRRLHIEEKKFAEAAAKFQAALNKCPAGHADRDTYQRNLNLANAEQAKVEEARRLNDQGRRLHNDEKKFAEAAVEFQAALNKCPKGDINEAIYENNLNLANAQQAKVDEASRLNSEGCRLHNEEKKFAEAAAKFQEALNKCPEDHSHRTTYQKNLDLANAKQAKVEKASRLNAEGYRLHHTKKRFA